MNAVLRPMQQRRRLTNNVGSIRLALHTTIEERNRIAAGRGVSQATAERIVKRQKALDLLQRPLTCSQLREVLLYLLADEAI